MRYVKRNGTYVRAEADCQVMTLPTASAVYLGSVYQYVGTTDSNYTHGYYYECVGSGSPVTYSWQQRNVQPQTAGDYIEKVTTMPTASSTEEGNEYQYMGADDSANGLIHAHFYECVSDGESTPTYSWHDLGYKKVWGPGHKADWDALSVAEKVQYDEAHFDDDEGTGVDAYSTTETKTNKVWIDGKPIYRKASVAATQGAVNAGTWVTMATVSDIESVVYVELADVGDSPFHFSNIITKISGSNVQIIPAGQGWSAVASNTTRYIILEYTKTTD